MTEHASVSGRIEQIIGIAVDGDGELLFLDYPQGQVLRLIPNAE